MNPTTPDNNPNPSWTQRITLATIAGAIAGIARAITTWLLTQLTRHP